MNSKFLLLGSLLLFSAYAHAEGKPAPDTHIGEASVYSDKFEGKKTASGDEFNQQEKTAASKTLPLGSTAKITNQETGKSTEVKITDRGPYAKDRKIDLSKSAAKDIGMPEDGLAEVKIEKTK